VSELGGINFTEAGERILTASYTENGIKYTGSLKITVTDIILEGKLTTDKYFAKGADILSDLKLVRISGSESVKIAVPAGAVSGYNAQSYGKQRVTVSYEGLTKTYDIVVADIVIKNTVDLGRAIGNQADGQYWFLENGTYSNQIVLTRNVVIEGESRDGVIIVGPPDVAAYHAMQVTPAYVWNTDAPRSFTGLIELVGNTATVKNLTVAGNPVFAGEGRLLHESYVGIAIVDATATIDGVTIKDIRYDKPEHVGMQNGFGIYAISNTKDTTVNNSVIEGFGKTGMISRIKTLTFTNNTVIGSSDLHVQSEIAQNGLQTGNTSVITGNTFKNLFYSGADEACGIILAGVSRALIDEIGGADTVLASNEFIDVQCKIYDEYTSISYPAE
jgi:hypothetical protein